MRVFTYLLSLCIVFASAGTGFAQKEASHWAPFFEEAYAKYPDLPKGILESMAYAASRMENLQPLKLPDEHVHQPPRYGIFALVKDGKGYFRNTLSIVCREVGISEKKFLRSPRLQILTMAAFLSKQAVRYKAHGYEGFAPVLRELSEIPANNTLNRYAQDLQLYEVYRILEQGVSAGQLRTQGVKINMEKIFGSDNLRILSSPEVLIYEEKTGKFVITDGEASYVRDGEEARTTDYPYARWVPASSSNYSSRNGTAISAVTIHTTQGSYAGAISWFQNPSARVSAHYVIRSSDGQITQMVREYNKAWHVAYHNHYTIGIEHEGYISNPAWYTDAMYRASANLVKNICSRRGISPTSCYRGPSHSGIVVLSSAYRIKGHQHFSSQTHTDPGIHWNWYKYYDLINGGSAPACNLAKPSSLGASGISTTAATLSWQAVSGAASYVVRYRVKGTSTWVSRGTTATSLRLSGLQQGKTYEWQVAAKCSNGSAGSYSYTALLSTASSHQTTTACNGTFTDTGGSSGNYGNNEHYIFTINPAGATGLVIDFYSFSLASGDYLYVFDGTDITAPMIGAYTGTNSPGVIRNDGPVTFKFLSNASGVSWGWRAAWSCESCQVPSGLAATQIGTNRAKLSWNGSGDSFTVRYRIQGASAWSTATANDNNYMILTGLQPGKMYEWQVRANCDASSSTFSASSYFATAQSHTVVTACSGTFTDTGGSSGNYGNSENYIYTIDPPGSTPVVVDFYSFGLASGDYLYILDGADVTAPLMGAYTGTNSPGRVVSSGGAITFKFVSNGSGVSWGWRANWSCASAREAAGPQQMLEQPLTVEVYPNPARGQFMLRHYGDTDGQTAEAALYELSGRVVWQRSLKTKQGWQEEAVDVSALSPGIYILRYMRGDIVENRRLIVE
ncbi:MAG: hypothetical protein KatS3mg033_0507 [Thermonema sp.]|nr:MAG: hypothetical protein KatS3mg033_0507 [Thermonema sp.]